MLALAIFRVSKPHGRRSLLSGRTLVAHISPQAAGFGLARSRSQHGHGGIVGVDFASRQNMLAQGIDQRIE
jgi:hypothetical protein